MKKKGVRLRPHGRSENFIKARFIIRKTTFFSICIQESRRMRCTGHVARILTGKHTENRPFGRPRRRWEDNIRIDLEEVNAGN